MTWCCYADRQKCKKDAKSFSAYAQKKLGVCAIDTRAFAASTAELDVSSAQSTLLVAALTTASIARAVTTLR